MFLNLLLNAPPDFWHDSSVQLIFSIAVALVVGIVSAIVAIWIYHLQRKQKEITYQVISDAPVASVNEEVKDRVEIRFDGSPVKDLSILVLKVWNSGNTAIRAEDYFEPIKFDFKGRTVVSSDVLETEPIALIDQDAIKTFLTQGNESIKLPKFPLNQKDAISLKILLTGTRGEISKEGRIADGSITAFAPAEEVSYKKQSRNTRDLLVLTFFLLLMLTFIFTSGIFIILNPPTPNTNLVSYMTTIMLIFIAILVVIFAFISIVLIMRFRPYIKITRVKLGDNDIQEQNTVTHQSKKT
jgi:phosphate transport system substrate-binding protein